VPSSGLKGAAVAMVIAALVHLAAATGVLLHLFSSPPKYAVHAVAPEIYGDNWEPGL